MDTLTKNAVGATFHCLTGCAIGEILGMIIGSSLGWHDLSIVALSITLAFVFGYALSILPIMRSGLGYKKAIKVALAADTVSIASMEIVDNVIMLLIPGAIAAGVSSGLFWLSLTTSLAVAFVVTVPVNRFLIGRGLGHAFAHKYHHGHSDHDKHH